MRSVGQIGGIDSEQKHHFNEPSVQHPGDKKCTLPLQAGAGGMIFPISVLEYGYLLYPRMAEQSVGYLFSHSLPQR